MLLEREALLAALESELVATRAGAGRLVLVTGEAGIGKSAATAAFLERHAHQVRTLVGYCDPLESPRPLGPFVDMAADLSQAVRDALAAETEATRVLGLFRDELGDRPTIAVVEDCHWADGATLDLVVFLARRIAHLPLMLLLTFRADEVRADHPLRRSLGRLAGQHITRLPLTPLSVAAVATLSGSTGSDAAALHRLTGGNPFHVTEVLAGEPGALPGSVADSVAARAAGLSPAARSTLDALSVLSRGGSLDFIVRLVPDAASVDECCDAGLLLCVDAHLTFRHELARRAIEQSIPPVRRRALHGLVLRLLGGEPSTHPAEQAHHAREAGDDEATVRHSLDAARHAVRLGSSREAAFHFRSALGAMGPTTSGETRACALEGHGAAALIIGLAAEATASFESAADLRERQGDLDAAALDRVEAAVSRAADGRAPAAMAAIDRLVEELAARDSAVLALACATQAGQRMLARDAAGAVQAGMRGVALADAGDARALASAWNAIGAAQWLSRPDEAEASLERGLDVARAADLQQQVATILVNLGSGAGEVRRYPTAVRRLDEAVSWCESHDLDGMGSYATAWRARVAMEQGDWPLAAQLGERVAAAAESLPISRIVALTVLGVLRARRDDPGAAGALDEAWRLAVATGHLQRMWPVASARAELAWWTEATVGDVGTLHAVLEQSVAARHEWAAGELTGWLLRGGEPVAVQHVAHPYRAVLAGRHADAHTAWLDLGCPFEAAWVLLDQGTESSVRRALEQFEILGASVPARRCRETLRSLGVRSVPRGSRTATAEHPHRLTPREAEVLDLLRAHLTNREIAARLVLSPRTVDHHVAEVLRKLGVTRRAEAAALPT